LFIPTIIRNIVIWYFAYFFNSFVHFIFRFSLILGIAIHFILNVFQSICMSHLPLSRDLQSDHVMCNLQSCICLKSLLLGQGATANGSEKCKLWILVIHENIGSTRRRPFSVKLFIFFRHSSVTTLIGYTSIT